MTEATVFLVIIYFQLSLITRSMFIIKLFFKTSKDKKSAFTLMELLLVLLLISGLIIAGRTLYEKFLLRKDIQVTQQNVQLLFDILDKNFYKLTKEDQAICDSTIQTSSITNEEWALILHTNLIPNTGSPSSHPNFMISCVPQSGVPAKLVIKAPLNVSSDQLPLYAEKLGGVVDGSYVKWQKISTYTHAGKDPLWYLSGQLGRFKSALTIPDGYLITELGPFYDRFRVSLSYSIKGVTNTMETQVSYSDTVTNKVKLPFNVNSINITNVKVYCSNGMLLCDLGSIGEVKSVDNKITAKMNFTISETVFRLYFYVNSNMIENRAFRTICGGSIDF